MSSLIACARQFYERQWMWGTAGNLSVKLNDHRLEIAITPSGMNKGHLTTKDLVILKDTSPHPHPPNLYSLLPLREKVPEGRMRGLKKGPPPLTPTLSRKGRGGMKWERVGVRGPIPSAETIIHQALYRTLPDCGAVFHVHPIYATLISSLYGHPKERRSLPVEWFEMMKGVGVGEEESAEVPIFPNWQDVSLIARDIRDSILNAKTKALPVALIYNHGLTAWGKTTDQARNHLEIMEYVCRYLYLKRIAYGG